MKKILIVNADDCNLTPGVTRAILDCHDHGIVTSTTFLVNLPVDREEVKRILKRKKLGVGLHLNVTLGDPVSKPSQVRSLLDPGGHFLRPADFCKKNPAAKELFREYQNQIKRFRKIFRRMPTHLDTHHQLHDQMFFYKVLARVARIHRLPIRRSKLMPAGNSGNIKTTGRLLGCLDPKKNWTHEKLKETLRRLPDGLSEIFCHPGENDAWLREISSFTFGREKEWHIFKSGELRDWLRRSGIVLSHYGLCYNP